MIDSHSAIAQAATLLRHAREEIGLAAGLPGLPDELRAAMIELHAIVAGEALVLERLREDQLQLPAPETPEQAHPDNALPPHPARSYGLERPRRRA